MEKSTIGDRNKLFEIARSKWCKLKFEAYCTGCTFSVEITRYLLICAKFWAFSSLSMAKCFGLWYKAFFTFSLMKETVFLLPWHEICPMLRYTKCFFYFIVEQEVRLLHHTANLAKKVQEQVHTRTHTHLSTPEG